MAREPLTPPELQVLIDASECIIALAVKVHEEFCQRAGHSPNVEGCAACGSHILQARKVRKVVWPENPEPTDT